MMFGACTSLLDAMRAGRLHTVTLVLADLESDGWRIPVGADLAAMYCGVPAATVVQPPARRVEQLVIIKLGLTARCVSQATLFSESLRVVTNCDKRVDWDVAQWIEFISVRNDAPACCPGGVAFPKQPTHYLISIPE
jgi:hypothetical protein